MRGYAGSHHRNLEGSLEQNPDPNQQSQSAGRDIYQRPRRKALLNFNKYINNSNKQIIVTDLFHSQLPEQSG